MGVDDINRLLARPWPGLQGEVAERLRDSLKDREIKNDNLRLKLELDEPGVTTDFDRPPGYTRFTDTQLQFAVPLDEAGWGLTISGRLDGHWDVRVPQKLFRLPIRHRPLRIVVSGLRLVLDADLDAPPAARPVLRRVLVRPALTLETTGFVALRVVLQAPAAPATAGFEAPVRAPIPNLGDTGTDALFEGTIRLALVPEARVTVSGRLTVRLAGVPVRVPLTLAFPIALPPSVAALLPALDPDNPPAPWGRVPQHNDQVSCTSAELRAVTDRIEKSLPVHAPRGTVFDVRYRPGFDACSDDPNAVASFYGSGDSAIWSGHLLAAEALRYAVNAREGRIADAKAARDRARFVLGGIEKLFDVPAHFLGRRGLLCRAAVPKAEADRVEEREKGVPFFLSAPPPEARSRFYDPVPIAGENWYGKGRDTDPPSRDSHLGIVLGLCCAWRFFDDAHPDSADLRTRAGGLLTDLLNFLIANSWNVPTPRGPIPTLPPTEFRIITSFFHLFHQQLAFLRAGATVAPAVFGAAYRDAARAADAAWLPIWVESAETIGSYFKFNLAHGSLFLLMLLEDDAALRASYARAFGMLRAAIGHHRNAYFNLIWMLADPHHANLPAEGSAPPAGAPTGAIVTIRDETRYLLCEWEERRRWLPGPFCLPTYRSRRQFLKRYYDEGRLRAYPSGEPGRPGDTLLADFPLPIDRRGGRDMDFVWQRDPFKTGVKVTAGGGIVFDDGEPDPRLEAPGVDYLLAYWLAAFLRVV